MAEDSTLNLSNLNDNFLDLTMNSSNNIHVKKLTIQEVEIPPPPAPLHFFFFFQHSTIGYS